MYKMVAIDLDGTLLNSYGEISEGNKKMLREEMEKGVEIVLASGRVLDSVINYSKEIGELNYAISGNGALLYDIKRGKALYNRNLNKEKVLEIIKICESNSIYYSIHTMDGIIANHLDHNVMVYQNDNITKKKEKGVNITLVQNISEYLEFTDANDFLKISICDEDKSVFSSIMRRLRGITGVSVLEVAHMSKKSIKIANETIPIEYFYTEITNENVNKWEAIKVLLGKLGIERTQVICIGDNVNDKEMLENAGLGVAMGNSAPDVKEVAKAITLDNNSDGVAKVLKICNL